MLAGTIKQLGFSSAILAAMVTAGCASLSGGKEPLVQTFELGKSFAYNVSMLAHINTPKTAKPHIEDVELPDGSMQSIEKTSSDLLGVGLAGGMLAFPSSIGSSGMNGFMAVDLLLGSLSGPPTLTMHRHATIAWFPADQASSAKDAMDKMHEMRVKALKQSIIERGMKITTLENDLNFKNLPWEQPRHYAKFIVEEFEDLCTKDAPCRFNIGTKMPAKKVVMAPKELTGQSFPAYFFKAGEAEETSGMVMYLNNNQGDDSYYGLSRDFENVVWLTKHQPDWMVHYIAIPKPQTPELLKKGPKLINPFPYMVHKGEVKLFAVEKKVTKRAPSN